MPLSANGLRPALAVASVMPLGTMILSGTTLEPSGSATSVTTAPPSPAGLFRVTVTIQWDTPLTMALAGTTLMATNCGALDADSSLLGTSAATITGADWAAAKQTAKT